jgi:hypothetical protein
MTNELSQALWSILIIAIACAILAPILSCILPDRTKSV